jgi:hypothetical protein
VKGSLYAKVIKKLEFVHQYTRENVPDLHDVFVRGLDYSNSQSGEPDILDDQQDQLHESNDITQRGYCMVGTRQLCPIKEHSVTLPGQHKVATTTTNTSGFRAISRQPYNGPQTFSAATGNETRPRNSALFYYVKIN